MSDHGSISAFSAVGNKYPWRGVSKGRDRSLQIKMGVKLRQRGLRGSQFVDGKPSNWYGKVGLGLGAYGSHGHS